MLLLALALAAASGGAASGSGSELISAAGAGDAAAIRRLIASGADPDAPRATGWTALMEAAANGRLEAARALLEAGARPDARDRASGTALDVAERAGHDAVARLLRHHGARGSGRSSGDRVCVLRWGGDGYCGRVEAVSAVRYRLRVDRVSGCAAGCAADAECSEGRTVGGGGAGALVERDLVWTPSWCLTHTAVP